MPIETLLLQIAAVLITARGLGAVMQRLRQPAVIGEILAGIVLGPSILGRVAPDALSALFPADAMPILDATAQLGLVVFLFLVGLEFDVATLHGRWRQALSVSTASIALPFGLGTALGVALHGAWAPAGIPVWAFATFTGAAMSVTAFPVLARILAERHLLRTPAGGLALAAAALNDVTAWVGLAFLVGALRADDPGSAWRALLGTAAFGAWMVTVVRPALARVGPRAGSDLSPGATSLMVVLLLLSAATTAALGVHALFGAFFLGAVVPRRGGVAEALTLRFETVVRVMLLPLFFASSGLRTQLDVLADPSAWPVTLLVLAVAVVGKVGGAWLAARASGIEARTALELGVLMNTRGLMELVVLHLGRDLGVIDDRMFTVLVTMALVTTAMTGPWLAWLDRARPQPRTPAGRPTLVVAVLDPAIVPTLAALAAAWARETHGRVVGVHFRSADVASEALRDDTTPLGDVLGDLGAALDALGVRHRLEGGASANVTADLAAVCERKGAEALILGVHRSLLGHAPLGGVPGALASDRSVTLVVVEDRGVPRDPRVTYSTKLGADVAPIARRFGGTCGPPGDLHVVPWDDTDEAAHKTRVRILPRER
jgi:Kef-type K+ transport system membrane component KefB